MISATVAQNRYRPGGSVGGGAGGAGGFNSDGTAGSLGGFGDSGANGGSSASDGPRGSLEETIPGVPGDDYPIFAEVPETSFLCDGQVDGGYYADPESECQAFHICANDGNGGLTKYSFLCPNGTIFQQQYFVCDWWFNVDCSLAEQFYSLNDQVAAERQANSPPDATGANGSEGYQNGGSQGGGRRGGGGKRGGVEGLQGSASSSKRTSVSASSSQSGSGYAAPGSLSGYGRRRASR